MKKLLLTGVILGCASVLVAADSGLNSGDILAPAPLKSLALKQEKLPARNTNVALADNATLAASGLVTSEAGLAEPETGLESYAKERTLLIDAYKGNIDGIRRAIADGINLNYQESVLELFSDPQLDNGITDLDMIYNDEASSFDDNNKDTTSALREAAYSGHLEIVNLLLANGADPNILSEGGHTALMSAASSGHLEIVRLLLANGARPNLQCAHGTTALMEAARAAENSAAIIQLLLANGADPNLQTNDSDSHPGSTAVLFAVDRLNLEATRALLTNSATAPVRLVLQVFSGDTASSDFPIFNRDSELAELLLRGDLETIKTLLTNSAAAPVGLGLQVFSGDTASADFPIFNQDLELVQLLLAHIG